MQMPRYALKENMVLRAFGKLPNHIVSASGELHRRLNLQASVLPQRSDKVERPDHVVLLERQS